MAKSLAPKCAVLCCTDDLRAIFSAGEKRQLRGHIFRGCELNRIDFSNTDLREAIFLHVSLNGSDFTGADLRGASFVGCDLRGANFAGAAFERTRFDDSWLVGARGLSPRMSNCARGSGGLLWLS